MIAAFGQFERLVDCLKKVVPELAILCGNLDNLLEWRLRVDDELVGAVSGVVHKSYDLDVDCQLSIWAAVGGSCGFALIDVECCGTNEEPIAG